MRVLREGVQSPQPQEPAFLLSHLCQRSAKRLEPGSVSRKKKRSQGRPLQGKASVRGSCRKELRAVDHRLQMPSMLGKVA